jgi:tetratricopeptide (TPR) repeat protein
MSAIHDQVKPARKNRLLLSISVSLLTAINAFLSYPQVVGAYTDPALDRGRNRMAHGDYDGAVNALGEALGMNDQDPTAYVLRGECFFKLGNFKLAIQDLNNAIQYAPNNVRAFLIRGSCHASLGEDDSAIADYEGAIKLDPSLGRNYFRGGGADVGMGSGNGGGTAGGGNAGRPRRGRMLTRNGRTTIVEEGGANDSGLNLHAIQDYKQAMKLVYPNGLAGGRQGSGRTDGNASDRDDAQANNNGNNNTRNNNSNTASNNDNAQGGSAPGGGRQRRRRRQGPDQANASTGGLVGGGVDSKQTDTQNNVDMEQDTRLPGRNNKRYVKALDQDPNRAVFGIIPGAGEFQGNAKQAVTDFTETIRNNPTDPNVYYQRAKALQKLGRVDDALKDYNEAIHLDPQKSQYYIGRASVFYQLSKPLLAEAEITKGRAVDPDVPGVVRFALPKYPPSVKWGGGDGPGGH